MMLLLLLLVFFSSISLFDAPHIELLETHKKGDKSANTNNQ